MGYAKNLSSARSRSSPDSGVADTAIACPDSDTVASGWASRFDDHAGWVVWPKLLPSNRSRSPSRRYDSGFVRGWPDLRPTVVNSSWGSEVGPNSV